MNQKARKKDKKILSYKQQDFINEYCSNGFNGSAAYKKAYPDCKSGHEAAASRLLRNVKIKEAITAKLKDRAKKVDVTIDYVLQKILNGLELAEKRGDLPAIARFTDQLGRYLAMFTDNIRQSGKELTINVSSKGQETGKEQDKPRLAAG